MPIVLAEVKMVVLVWIALALLVGVWARSWKRNAVLWCVLALVLSPLLVGLALLISGNATKHKTCPKCAESVKFDALVCKHCSHSFEISQPSPGLVKSGTSGVSPSGMTKQQEEYFNKMNVG